MKDLRGKGERPGGLSRAPAEGARLGKEELLRTTRAQDIAHLGQDLGPRLVPQPPNEVPRVISVAQAPRQRGFRDQAHGCGAPVGARPGAAGFLWRVDVSGRAMALYRGLDRVDALV